MPKKEDNDTNEMQAVLPQTETEKTDEKGLYTLLTETNKTLRDTVTLLAAQIQVKKQVPRYSLSPEWCRRIKEQGKRKDVKTVYKLRGERSLNGHRYTPVDEKGNRANFEIYAVTEKNAFIVKSKMLAPKNPEEQGVSVTGEDRLIGKYLMMPNTDTRLLLDNALSKFNATDGQRKGFYVTL